MKTCGIALALALALAALAGCAGLGTGDAFDPLPIATVPAAGSDAGELGVEIGTGATEFVELRNGDAVDVVFGPQGGYHLWASVRVRAHDPEARIARIQLGLRFEDGRPAGPASLVAVPLPEVGNPVSEQAGLTCFVADPAAVRGVRVIMRADVTSVSGRSGFAERLVVPR